jgi:beta-glucosidase
VWWLVAAAVVVAAALFGAGCRRRAPEARALFRDPTLPAAERAADLVGRMTRAEKIQQLMTLAPAIPRLGVPAYDWWNEALHGVARAGRATVFPQAIGLAATFDEGLMRRVADVISDEARAKYNLAQRRGERGRYQGLTFFSPNVNIFRDPRWGRGHETLGEDPFLTARMAVAFIKGMQGDDPAHLKTAATAKHFAVHSGPEAERHRFDARASAHDLADTYLPQFEAAVREAHVASVMAAYNRVNGVPATANGALLADTLRGAWGFDGYVVGDCGAVDDILWGHHVAASREEAAALALRAGTDLDCGGAFGALRAAAARGLVTDAEIDRAATRLFTARFRLGMLDPPSWSGSWSASWSQPWARLGAETIESPAHLALAREAAARSFVLAENRGATLPIGSAVRRLAIVGPTADDLPVLLANYHGTPSHPVTLLQGVREAARARGVEVRYAQGSRLLDGSDAARAEAVVAAEASDLTVAIMGLDPRLEGEELDSSLNPGGDRADIALPIAQQKLLDALLKTKKRVVLVVTGGGAVSIPWDAAAQPAAILYIWYPGAEGGHALADVLFGDVSPAGRLPITIYRSVQDLPPFTDYAMAGRTYRYFTGEPLYPFGHGLSYNTFEYASLQIELPAGDREGSMSVDVQNAGSGAGDEVVQAYVIPRGAPAFVPRRWLAGFVRVTLAAGERRRVRLTLSRRALSYVDENGRLLPFTGDVVIAVGGGQPDRGGAYAGARFGVTASIQVGSMP